MKRKLITLILCFALIVAPTQKSHAIVWVVVKAAVKKVFNALNIALMKQQNKVIWLQNAEKTAENIMAKAKLNEISDWTKKQKDQYGKYFEELRKVKQAISYYQRVKEITGKQSRILGEYQLTWRMIRNDKHFTAEELDYMGKVYGGILEQSVKNLEEIMVLINSFTTQMSDAARLELINKVADKIDLNYIDLTNFSKINANMSLQRAKDAEELLRLKQLYGLE